MFVLSLCSALVRSLTAPAFVWVFLANTTRTHLFFLVSLSVFVCFSPNFVTHTHIRCFLATYASLHALSKLYFFNLVIFSTLAFFRPLCYGVLCVPCSPGLFPLFRSPPHTCFKVPHPKFRLDHPFYRSSVVRPQPCNLAPARHLYPLLSKLVCSELMPTISCALPYLS